MATRRRAASHMVVALLLGALAPTALVAAAADPPRPTAEPIVADVVNDRVAANAQVVDEHAARPAILRAQILLDRASFSVGEIDGKYGGNMGRAIDAFQRARDLPPTGVIDAQTWAALEQDGPVLVPYEITPADVAGPFATAPADMMRKAKLPALYFASPLEALGESFHASPALLTELNPGAAFDVAGTRIVVPDVAVPLPPPARELRIVESDRSVSVIGDDGKVVARYPATMGSRHDPLPIGRWKVTGTFWNPQFHYNPRLFWDARRGHAKATIQPGPNNPVGVVWIDLSKEHTGIHGAPEPGQIARSQSHGCIRLTNWDAIKLGQQVHDGTPVVATR